MTMMIDGLKSPAPEQKVMETGSEAPLVVSATLDRKFRGRTMDVVHVVLRLCCLVASAAGVCFMVTAKQSATISLYGFDFPVHSKWSFSCSFEYLVGVSSAVAGHSLLQLIIGTTRLLRRTKVSPNSRNHVWLLFAADQAFALATISAGSAASGVTNLNHAGIKHTALPNFCKPLRRFCDHVGLSIAFTFLSCFFLLVFTVLHVIWLSRS